jgi:hypothetical protein
MLTVGGGFELVVCNDADGGLRLSPSGALGIEESQRLNEAIIAALRAGVPRLEVDVRDASWADDDGRQVLERGRALARHLDIEFRVTGSG